MRCCGNVRFEDEHGQLVDYDPSLVKIEDTESKNGNDLTEYAYENKVGDSKQYMPRNLSENTPLLMEKEDKEMSISMTEETLKELDLLHEEIEVEREVIENAYQEEIKAKVDAAYESKNEGSKVLYTSASSGIKESIILNKIPKSNVFTYRINLKGMYPVRNEETGCIVFFDEETNEMTGWIPKPFMNDAGQESYSESIQMEIKEEEEEEKESFGRPEEASEEVMPEAKEESPTESAEAAEGTGVQPSEEAEEPENAAASDNEKPREENEEASDTYILTLTVDESYLKAEKRQS